MFYRFFWCFAIWVVYIQIIVTWGKGIHMSVFLFKLVDVLLSWCRKLSCTTGLAVFSFIGFMFWFCFGFQVLLTITIINIITILCSPLVYCSIDLMLLIYYTLSDSCYILCLSYCIDLLTYLLLVVYRFPYYHLYLLLLACYMTWVQDKFYGTCTWCSLILLYWGQLKLYKLRW